MDIDATPPATEHPTRSHYDCWVEAGGGTVMFDADKYVGLMRDARILRAPVSLTEVLGRVLERQADPSADLEGFGRILTDELGRQGYRIHSISKCIRLSDELLTEGRPMSPAEEEQLLLPAIEAAPTARPRTVGPTFDHTTPEGDLFKVPEDWVPGEGSSRCRSCQALILWTTTPRGKRAPLNQDGTSHFSDCPQSAQWRKKP